MDKLFNWIAVLCSIVGGYLAELLGGFDALLIALVTLVCMDYITGIIKAVATKKLSSAVSFRGLIKKIVIFIIVSTAVVIQGVIGDSIPLREVIIMFYIANEGISLLENAAEFIPLPQKLKSVLIQLRKKGEQE